MKAKIYLLIASLLALSCTTDFKKVLRTKPQKVIAATESGFILSNRIEVVLKGIEPDKGVKQYLSRYMNKKVKLKFSIDRDYKPHAKKVYAYALTTDKKTCINRDLILFQHANLDTSLLKDSLQRYTNYAQNSYPVDPSDAVIEDAELVGRKKVDRDLIEKPLEELVIDAEKAVFMVYTLNRSGTIIGQGTGFFVGEGLAISNEHVFEGGNAWKIKIFTHKGQRDLSMMGRTIDQKSAFFSVTNIVERNSKYDYVIFKVDIKNNDFLPIVDQRPLKGEEVFTIGNPEGLENTVTTGIISAYRDEYMLQMSTPIAHGSSGSPVINMKGEVVGLATSGSRTFKNGNFARDIQIVVKNLHY